MSLSAPFIVIDPGSGYFKSGFAGSTLPSMHFPTVIGHSKVSLISLQEDPHKVFVGQEAISRSCLLHLKYPIESGVIISWEDFWSLFDIALHVLSDKKVKPEMSETNIILSEIPMRPRNDRKQIIEYLFETLGINGLHIAPTNIFDLYSVGKISGLILDSGECITSCIGVSEGCPAVQSLIQHSFGGRDLNDRLVELLHTKYGISLLTSSQREYARQIKEDVCDFSSEQIPLAGKSEGEALRELILPDGKAVKINPHDLREIPEMLFSPSTSGLYSEYCGFTNLIMQSLEKCNIDSRPNLLRNIILAGGNTGFNNIATKLKEDIMKLVPLSMQVDICAEEDRSYSAWKGGSVLGQLSSTKDYLLTKKAFEEQGSSIVLKSIFPILS